MSCDLMEGPSIISMEDATDFLKRIKTQTTHQVAQQSGVSLPKCIKFQNKIRLKTIKTTDCSSLTNEMHLITACGVIRVNPQHAEH
jgi:hypothetical protein